VITLTDRHGIGHVLWKLRRAAGISPEGMAARLAMSRSGVLRREGYGHMPAAALVEHAQALGCTVALIPPRVPGRRSTGTGWPA
jgi:hypothetical protein